ncbi:regulator, partial [Pseudomonas amygdali pv. tabaci str. ATCC 11528]
LEVYEDYGPQECDLIDEPDLVIQEISGTSGVKMVWVSTHTKTTLIRSFLSYLSYQWNVALRLSATRRR